MDSPCGDMRERASCGETTNIVVVRGPFWPFRCFFSTTFGRHHATHDPNEWSAFASVAVLVFWVAALACGVWPPMFPCLPASTKQGLLRSALPPLTSHAHTHYTCIHYTQACRGTTTIVTLSASFAPPTPSMLFRPASYIPRPFACHLPRATP